MLCVFGTGKAFEDRRGESVTTSKMEKSWLYLNGYSVLCSHQMELAAMVSSVNPSINNSTDSLVLSALQQVGFFHRR